MYASRKFPIFKGNEENILNSEKKDSIFCVNFSPGLICRLSYHKTLILSKLQNYFMLFSKTIFNAHSQNW